MTAPLVLAHGEPDHLAGGGSALYDVLGAHVPGLVALSLLPVVGLAVRWSASRGGTRAGALLDGYRERSADRRVLVWLLAASATIHLGLAAAAPLDPLAGLFLADTLGLWIAARRIVLDGRWRRLTLGVLCASIVAYAVAIVSIEPPDQVGLFTKLVELGALALAARPLAPSRVRSVGASLGTVLLVVTTGSAAWIGAFRAGEDGGVPPGTIVGASADRPASPAERAAADRLYVETARTLARYRDAARAVADGYDLDGLAGVDFHAANARYADDGRILDPARPEQLIYAATPSGPVLLGAMFEMPELGEPGPAFGGPLTHWHGHENVCFSLIPPAMASLVSPFGGCPLGSIAVPRTAEMIHVWIVPGAGQRFGDVDEAARAAYVDAVAASLQPR